MKGHVIKVHKDGSDYVLRDDAGMQYGKYFNKDEANDRCSDWNAYYEFVDNLQSERTYE